MLVEERGDGRVRLQGIVGALQEHEALEVAGRMAGLEQTGGELRRLRRFRVDVHEEVVVGRARRQLGGEPGNVFGVPMAEDEVGDLHEGWQSGAAAVRRRAANRDRRRKHQQPRRSSLAAQSWCVMTEARRSAPSGAPAAGVPRQHRGSPGIRS